MASAIHQQMVMTPSPTSSKLMCPKSVEVADSTGCKHPVDVEVLGVEETWRTPSILLAIDRANNGRAIFSQVHLEADPAQFEGDEGKYEALKNSNAQRLEILCDLLSTHLHVEVQPTSVVGRQLDYSPGYLLADDRDLKEQFLKRIAPQLDASGCLSSGAMNLAWVDGQGEAIPKATEQFLPIHVAKEPEGFDVRKYFEVS